MPKLPHKPLIVKLGLILVLITGLIIGGKQVLSLFDGPSAGSVSAGKTKTVTGSVFDMTLVTIHGKYISFNYPAGITHSTSPKLIAPDVENFSFIKHDIETWNLEIAVTSAPNGLTSFASYSYRSLHPDIYQLSQRSVGKQMAIIMTDKTAPGFSEVAYLVQGSLIGTISLYGDGSQGTKNLQSTFGMVLNSWQWLHS